jgi:hypothetical protein
MDLTYEWPLAIAGSITSLDVAARNSSAGLAKRASMTPDPGRPHGATRQGHGADAVGRQQRPQAATLAIGE